MTNANTLLARLNTLRVANGARALKAPMSIAKMNDAIAALTPTNERASFFANLCREYGVNPKVGRALYRRHIGLVSEFDENNKKAVDKARELLSASAQRIAA